MRYEIEDVLVLYFDRRMVSNLTLPFSEGRNVYGEEDGFIGKGVSGVQQEDCGLAENQPFRTGFGE